MARGYVYKRCRLHGITGTPARGAKPAIPACRTCRPPAGTWSWRAEGPPDPATGRRTQPSRGGFATRDDAQEALSRYLTDTAGGRHADDRRLTVAQWLRRWLNAGEWEPATRKDYTAHVETLLIPHLGHLRLRDLRHHHVEQMCAELLREREAPARGPGSGKLGNPVAKRAPRTVDKIRRTLRSALSAAVRRGLIGSNPASGRIESVGKVGKSAKAWWQPAQLRQFLEFASADPLHDLWVVAAYTGLRREELLGLRWEDCDLDEDDPDNDYWAGVRVRQRCTGTAGLWPCRVCGGKHRGRQILAGGKTEESSAGETDGWVPLGAPARLALLDRRTIVLEHKDRWGSSYVDHGLVWAEHLGAPLRPDVVTKKFAALVAASGLPKVNLHQMGRHGTATALIGAGVPMEQVRQVLRHASEDVTRGVYTHAVRGALAAGMAAMVGLVEGGSAQEVHNEGREDVGREPESGT